ncbi:MULTISPECIES: DNA-binding response regulator [unclassified Sphingomonas]|jgi:DNA-binding NarL/FixJ family response regulator|uniref:response regulator transcription factor n=1 Tax=unclassified Sphingomonas TaxID=196159 RepID=UPI0025DF8747|nr:MULTISPECIES: DNA-binding response regulator [unclassified Sphingomonas]
MRPDDTGATILVVDDTPESLRFLTATLEQAGMTVLIAIDGLATLDLLEHVVPDLILMDAVMPGLDGFATTRRIKQDGRFRHVPVIFMTGLADTEHVVRGLDAGAVDYVHKPIVVDELLARVSVHLANARISQSSKLALDTAGRPSFAVDDAGRTSWLTPLAAATIERLFPGWTARDVGLPDALAATIRRLQEPHVPAGALASLTIGDTTIQCTILRQTSASEWLFRLTEKREGDAERLLAERHGLTSREAEVLVWISRGKQNREISEILHISPRTVNKHLEQVFQKMGVENRASATAIAVATLAQ